MSFYTEKRKANKEIDDIIKKEVLAAGNPINLSKLILEITANHPVSDKSVKERVDHWISAQSEFLELADKEIRRKKVE